MLIFQVLYRNKAEIPGKCKKLAFFKDFKCTNKNSMRFPGFPGPVDALPMLGPKSISVGKIQKDSLGNFI